MTDNEIKKVLECCISYDCKNCTVEDCKDPLRQALDLINRQQAEIERLTILAKLGNMRADDYRAMRDKCNTTRAEAIKEFAERLKINYSKPLFAVGSYNEFIREVDNLVKEMAGEE
jgi:DNA-directed RNA polymerase specialized sigma54-like protein